MTKTKEVKYMTILAVCPQCAGRTTIPYRHPTNKRNHKACPTCRGIDGISTGEILKVVEVIE